MVKLGTCISGGEYGVQGCVGEHWGSGHRVRKETKMRRMLGCKAVADTGSGPKTSLRLWGISDLRTKDSV